MNHDPTLARKIVSEATEKMQRVGNVECLIAHDYAFAHGMLCMAANLGAITFREQIDAGQALVTARQDAMTALDARLREARRMAA